MDEGHDSDHNADETSQQGENHEGPGGIPVSCVCDRRQGKFGN